MAKQFPGMIRAEPGVSAGKNVLKSNFAKPA